MLIVVLSNLVRNAVEHTTSGTVRVEVEADRASVSDTGPGLPPALLEQLHGSGPQPDVGIGLATVQRICRRFEWRFEIQCPAAGWHPARRSTCQLKGTVLDHAEVSPDSKAS